MMKPFRAGLDIDGNGNTNGVRADRAFNALGSYASAVNHSPPRQGIDPALVQDLMNDILHAMHCQDMDEVGLDEFIELARSAHSGFLEESGSSEDE